MTDEPTDAELAELREFAGQALLAAAVRRTVRGLAAAALVGPVMAAFVILGWLWPYRAAAVAWGASILYAARALRVWAAQVELDWRRLL